MSKFTGFAWLICVLTVCTLTLPGGAQAKPASGNGEEDQVIAQALKPSPLESNLQHLTDEIGGRVPGTTAMQEAIAWAQEAFRAAGGENVHAEKFQIAHSWAESKTGFSVKAPVELNLH